MRLKSRGNVSVTRIGNVLGNGMDLRSGTPLWVTLALAVVALLGSHFLTVYREGKKSRQEREKAWRTSCQILIKEIVDDATKHYCDSTSLGAATDLSAAKINNNLKRLGALAREISAVEPSHSADLGRLLRLLRDVVTSPADYQMPNRELRRAADHMFTEISECESALISNLKKARK